ncbi:hypothetical protein IGI04_032161 [Brassica rapa subsp. trilocularis]|uniref:Inositol-pentakisphosphate 2-kinase n=1 Tax=Brassica rapa subsp. trilocularis TaxID=1813537 RepID=A0ABQ7LX79_BRACM|nr:hypothetical protein IGI04_032161 [Brassica rapa subsp. trilocularis]
MERASSSSSESSSSMGSSSSDQTSHFVTSSMLSRTSSSSSSAFGDYIGTESCFDILEENDVVSAPTKPSNRYRYGGRRREEREARAAAAREFPPPIPLLAQTENLLPHMPWVLKRVVTSDGRLILREEKVRHHEYFRAHRANGRLTLDLVAAAEETVVESGGMVGGGGSPRGKCMKSCFVGMTVREIRPMEIGLEPKDAVDWSYRGEGAVNLVLAYTGSSPSFLGKMMRIQKMPNDGKEDNGNTSGNGLTSHEKVIWGECKELVSCQNKEIVEFLFVKHVMRPLLGHKHVNPGMRLLVAKEFLESVENIVTSQRPSWRADAASVDTHRNSVLLMDDLTLFAHGRVEDKPCLSVEIKPKCGFLPSSSFIAEENVIKKSITRFEMHQVLKLHDNEISEISEYDPLDLFSGSKDRIHKAIRALYATPQNNFRVFLNGSLVFGGLGGGTCKTTSKVEQDFEHLLKDIIKTKDGSRANHFIELVAETVYTSGVLDHLLDVQKLDKYNIEGAVHVYYDLINQPCRVCKELEKSKTSSASQFSSMHSIPMAEKVNVLKEFLISATAKDCSVMISFRSTDAVISRSSSHSNLHLESAKQEFDYKVHFIDLDMRPLKKMEVYYELDKKIMNTYLEMVKKKEARGERRAQRQCF